MAGSRFDRMLSTLCTSGGGPSASTPRRLHRSHVHDSARISDKEVAHGENTIQLNDRGAQRWRQVDSLSWAHLPRGDHPADCVCSDLCGLHLSADSNAPKWLIAVVAIIWGVGGFALLYWVFNGIVERLPEGWSGRLQPFVFVGPAMAILFWYLAFPACRTFWLSLFDRNGFQTDSPCSFPGLGQRAFRATRSWAWLTTLRLPPRSAPGCCAQQHHVDCLRQHVVGGLRAVGGRAGRSQQIRAGVQSR